MHETIWPGENIESLKAKHAKPCDGDENQEVWLRERTIPTSLFISFIVHQIAFKFRNLRDRAFASTAFGNLILTMTTSLNGIDLRHTRFGSDDVVTIRVDPNGSVDGQLVWAEAFYVSRIRRTWDQDRDNIDKPWVTSRFGRGSVMLIEILTFLFDPQHDRDLTNLLWEPSLDLISQIAAQLDNSIADFFRNSDAIDMADVSMKSKRRMSSAFKNVWAEQIAQKLWKGEET